MPPLPPTANVLRFRIKGIAAGQNIDNIFHCSYGGGPPGPADCDSLAQQVGNQWISWILPHMSNQYVLSSCDCEDLTSSTAAVGSHTLTGTGGVSGTFAALNVCAVISWPISRRYRGGHPRTYISPIAASAVNTPNQLNPSFATALATDANSFVLGVNASTSGTTTLSQTGAVSYYLNKAERVAGFFEAFVLPPTVDLRPGSQRRRLGKLQATREIG